jgi:hypothetical protein
MGGLCSKVAEELDGDNLEFEMNANYYQVTTKGFEAVSYEIPEDADLDLIVQDYRDELASRGASQSEIDLAVAMGLFRETRP